MRPRLRHALLTAGWIVAAATGAGAQERYLFWNALDVAATLDSTGALHVRERHGMVFTGDWNGGERRFNLRFGQRLTLHRVVRVDPDGRETELVEGSLDAVDHYDRTGSVLRWRSRRPEDPPFQGTPLTYVLEYTLDRFLQPRDGTYVLDHDFAFPDRPSAIEVFTLKLDLDDDWAPVTSLNQEWRAERLQPGQGFVVTAPLRYQGASAPAGVRVGAPIPVRIGLMLLLNLVSLGMVVHLFRRERGLGRLADSEGVPVTPELLDAHVFNRPPEIIGALWDERTGSAEVAAIIARLVQERKLATRMVTVGWKFLSREVLELELLVSRSALRGYERDLVDALFEPNSKKTNLHDVQSRYRKTGFDPAGLVRPAIEAVIGNRSVVDAEVKAPRAARTLALFAGALALLGAGVARDLTEVLVVAVGVGIALALWLIGGTQAVLWRHQVANARLGALRWGIPALLLLLAVAAQLHFNPFRIGALVLAGFVVLALAIVSSMTHAGMSRRGAAHIAVRQRLHAAREYFRHELSRTNPQLQDAWVPWLVGFGLTREMDKWFAAFGAEGVSSRRTSTVSTGGGGSSGTDSSPQWSGMGGGGGFSGGGTAASFAALSSFSSGVSKPSSSSSSGGGGGGGSSGGGGGGGW